MELSRAFSPILSTLTYVFHTVLSQSNRLLCTSRGSSRKMVVGSGIGWIVHGIIVLGILILFVEGCFYG
jgi:hypothetical protein